MLGYEDLEDVLPVKTGRVEVAAQRESGGPYKLYYELYGRGKTRVILIAGYCEGKAFTSLTAKRMVKLYGYQVCVFTNRGAPYSSQVTPGYTIKDMSLDTLELLFHLRWFENVNVIGWSMGGMIALELSFIAPLGVISTLFLCATSAGHGLPTALSMIILGRELFVKVKDLHPYKKISIMRDFVFSKSWLKAAPEHGTKTSNRECVTEYMRREYDKEDPHQDTMSRIGQLMAICGHTVNRHRLKALGELMKSRIVVLATEVDRVVSPKDGEFLARHLGCKFIKFKEGEHMFFVEEPRMFFNVVNDLIKSVEK